MAQGWVDTAICQSATTTSRKGSEPAIYQAIEGCQMTFEDAKRILDSVKEGRPVPASVVNRAMQITGDLDDFDGEFCRLWRACGERQTEIRSSRGVREDVYT
jgi:(2Fe-2S) ferredoxin